MDYKYNFKLSSPVFWGCQMSQLSPGPTIHFPEAPVRLPQAAQVYTPLIPELSSERIRCSFLKAVTLRKKKSGLLFQRIFQMRGKLARNPGLSSQICQKL